MYTHVTTSNTHFNLTPTDSPACFISLNQDEFTKKVDYRKQREREIPLGGSKTRHFILKRSQMHYG